MYIYIFISLFPSIEIFQEKRRNFIDQFYLLSSRSRKRLKEKGKKGKSQFSNDPSSTKKKKKKERNANVSENVS